MLLIQIIIAILTTPLLLARVLGGIFTDVLF
jgi:hypothetical protein